MLEMNLTKVVTYELSYNGDSIQLFHYTDDKVGFRHQSWTENIEGAPITTLGVRGPGSQHQEISAQLVAERVYYEDGSGQKFAELIYLFPDIGCYFKFTYRKEFEMGSFDVLWGQSLTPAILKF